MPIMLIMLPMIGPEYAPTSAVAAFDEGNKRMHLAIPPAADREFAEVAADQIIRFRPEQIERGRVDISDIPCRSTVMMPSITL